MSRFENVILLKTPDFPLIYFDTVSRLGAACDNSKPPPPSLPSRHSFLRTCPTQGSGRMMGKENAAMSPQNPEPSSTQSETQQFTIEMEQMEDYAFRVRFDKDNFAPLHMDEPTPLGKESGPNASRVLAAAIGNCLSASLLFCARKGRIEIGTIQTKITVHTGRNERGRLRITGVRVEIDPHVPETEKQKALRCLDLFEDFCVVTQSIRQGIPVEVAVAGLEKLRVSPER
jgi:organic hydroperoxide reductase OsmC/OhrA